MSLPIIPPFVLFPVCFELGWGLFWYVVTPLYRRLSRGQALVAETCGNRTPEFLSGPRWLRAVEILFAATHIIPLAVLTSRSRNNTAATPVALVVNGLLLSAILYFAR